MCFAFVGVHVAWPAVAGATGSSGGTINDARRDVKGPLDIASVGYATVGGGQLVTHTVRLYSPFPSRSLKAPQAILGFAFDTDGDKRNDRIAVVFFADHALRAALAESDGHILSVVRARRPNSRTISVTFPSRAFGELGGYRWTALTLYKDRGRCRRTCVDIAPGRGMRLFDFTPPTIGVDSLDPYNFFAITPDYKFHLKVGDKGFSGVRSWLLEKRSTGQTDWSTVAKGSDAVDWAIPQQGTEGSTYEYRITAVDKQGNESVTTKLVSIPIDDASPLLAGAYAGGPWDAYENPGYQLFQHTAHRSAWPSSVFMYSFTGSYVAWLSNGGCCPKARVSIDGGFPQSVTVANSWKPFERGDLIYGPHTIRIEVDGEPGFEIDGIVTR